MQCTKPQKISFNLTSMHRFLQKTSDRRSTTTLSFKKTDVSQVNTTLNLISRRTSMAKTYRRLPVKQKVAEQQFRTTKDIGNKASYFDKYLSDVSILGDYKIMSHIGKGCFSTVSLAIERNSGINFAMKTYQKVDSMEYYRLDSIKRQIKHLKNLQHPNVVKLIHVIKDKKKIHLLMQNGGKQSLSGLLRKNKRFSEETARKYIKQLIEAVSYCHSSGVSHRDLKPENILVDDQGHITLIDFGFSASLKNLTTYCGTPPFMCPEITKKIPYSGAAADALGIILYQLIFGTLPFRATNEAQLYRLIQQGKYPNKESLSKNLKSLLDKMLNTDASARISTQRILSEPWFK